MENTGRQESLRKGKGDSKRVSVTTGDVLTDEKERNLSLDIDDTGNLDLPAPHTCEGCFWDIRVDAVSTAGTVTIRDGKGNTVDTMDALNEYGLYYSNGRSYGIVIDAG